MRRKFEEAQAHPWGSFYMAHLLPRMFLFRFYVLARGVANELGGYGACRHSRFNDVLLKMNEALLNAFLTIKLAAKFTGKLVRS